MPTTQKPRATRSAAVLFALAGMALLVGAYFNQGARPFVVGMQILAAVLFFTNAYLQHRRASRLL